MGFDSGSKTLTRTSQAEHTVGIGGVRLIFRSSAGLRGGMPQTLRWATDSRVLSTLFGLMMGCLATTWAPQASQGDDLASGWAHQPLQEVNRPVPQSTGRVMTFVDGHVQSALERTGVAPAPTVDRGRLFRRLHFDLWGLPPDPDAQRVFVADQSPDALSRLVERMLADPRFGQRWARHWLDLSRFAESLTLRGFVFPQAWRYRDYVVDSFNEDLPYSQFVIEQLAGDLVEGGSVRDRQRRLTATTVLMLGNTNLEEQNKKQLEMDVVDDQIDWLGTALLGQTLACARCHDHKFDPVSIRDYYGLAGIFKGVRSLAHGNVSKWLEVPLPLPPDETAEWLSREELVKSQQALLADAKQALTKLMTSSGGNDAIALASLPGVVVDDEQAKRVGEWKQSTSVKPYVGRGYLFDRTEISGEKSLTFQPELEMAGEYEVRLAYTPGPNRTARAMVTVFSADGERTVELDQRQPPSLDRVFVSLGRYRFEVNGAGHVLVATSGAKGHVVADAVQFLPVSETEKPSATAAKLGNDERARELKARIAEAEQALRAAQAQLESRPKVMTVEEQSGAGDVPVLLRGSVLTPGEVVPRGVPLFASSTGTPRPLTIPEGASGRQQLAEWLTIDSQPLLTRVYVNRVWSWLMGHGLVTSVDNWGTTGELPSHPELLDDLAAGFLLEGQSTKWLVRQVVLSAAYARSDIADTELRRLDPENRLWGWRDVRRLEAEEIRDSLLWVTGELSWEMRGAGFGQIPEADYGYQSDSRRRSLYVPQFRNSTSPLIEVFDCVDSSRVVGVRHASTVATQALVLLNDPFVEERLRIVAGQLANESGLTVEEGLSRTCSKLWGREPAKLEQQQLLTAFKGLNSELSPAERWLWMLQVLVNSLDFRHLR